jgi:hypothetical protein
MSDEPTVRTTGSATTTIGAPIGDVFAAVTDVTRMGERSPERLAARWIGDAAGPAVGARFEGGNLATLGPIMLKHDDVRGRRVRAGCALRVRHRGSHVLAVRVRRGGRGRTVTESFSHPPHVGWQKRVYGRLANRRRR